MLAPNHSPRCNLQDQDLPDRKVFCHLEKDEGILRSDCSHVNTTLTTTGYLHCLPRQAGCFAAANDIFYSRTWSNAQEEPNKLFLFFFLDFRCWPG